MYTLYYDIAFIASVLMSMMYMFFWQKHYDVHITIVQALTPVVSMGYALLNHATTLDAAMAANKIIYIGGCFMQLMILLVVFTLCDIRVSRWVKLLFMAISVGVYFCVLTMGQNSIFYTSATFENGHFIKHYGFMHTAFLVMIVLYFLAGMATVVYCYFRRNLISRKILVLLFLPDFVGIVSFFCSRWFLGDLDLMPAAYLVAQITYLMISRRIILYDPSATAVDTLEQAGENGFATFDFKKRYLGSNAAARAVFPALASMTVDRSNRKEPFMQDYFGCWIDKFQQDETNIEHHYELGDRIYQIDVSWLYLGRRRKGFQLYITDDTKDQEHIRFMDKFNEELNRKVEEKTAHIAEMHDNLVLSMATMVESRDNSTGGHIRRTSEGVRILIRAIRQQGLLDLPEDFCQRLIKAAPMHDLGKIAVDDAILRKPGRFTPEEFEQMKTHAAEGARIVHEILKGTDDQAFRHIAENVAHYHHERWDGSGYPEGKRAEEIPLEPRIMAVADVYDALVSKRVYKEKMSFEKANDIILQGMGTQFDPALESVYLLARPDLEAYYTSLEAGNEENVHK